MKHLLFIILTTLLYTNISYAVLVSYNDEAAFLAAAGQTTVYDFESDAAQFLKSPSYSLDPWAITDFGDFSIDSTSHVYRSVIRDDGTNHDLLFNSMNNSGFLDLVLSRDVTAFGFNWVAEGNNSYDYSTFSIAAMQFGITLGNPGTSGFFGLIETAGSIVAGTPFTFGQASTNWSAMSIDNITYSSNPVPEPATIFLFGTGLAGLVGFRRRKKKS